MELTLTDWLMLSGLTLAILAAVAKLTPWGWDDKLVAILVKALTLARVNKGMIERLSKRKGNVEKKPGQ